MSHPIISTKELQMKENATIIDVRKPEEFTEQRIPGAVNIPLASLHEYESENPDEKLYLVCRSGRRSGIAADILNEKGHQAVNVEGGMLDWDGPVEEN